MNEMSVADQAKAIKEKLTDEELNKLGDFRKQLVGELDQEYQKVIKKDPLEIATEEDVFDQQKVNPNLPADQFYNSDEEADTVKVKVQNPAAKAEAQAQQMIENNNFIIAENAHDTVPQLDTVLDLSEEQGLTPHQVNEVIESKGIIGMQPNSRYEGEKRLIENPPQFIISRKDSLRQHQDGLEDTPMDMANKRLRAFLNLDTKIKKGQSYKSKGIQPPIIRD